MIPDPVLLVLASTSPRRARLLSEWGLRFDVITPATAEASRPDESPSELVERLAEEKARAVERLVAAESRWVLAADTGVFIDGESLGKPESPADAVEMLLRIAGRTVSVRTGVAVVSGLDRSLHKGHETSHVSLRSFDRTEAQRYVATGEPLDKAGAFAIQGLGARFVDSLSGSRSNVVGLPRRLTFDLLAATGFPLPEIAN